MRDKWHLKNNKKVFENTYCGKYKNQENPCDESN